MTTPKKYCIIYSESHFPKYYIERYDIMLKKKLTAIAIASALVLSSFTAFAAGKIPDHKGTSMDGIAIGTTSVNSNVKSYFDLFQKYGNQYGVDPNLLASICQQESSGINYSYREDGSEYPAWGIMQIEYTMEKQFAQFGLENTGTSWTLQDRLDPEKSISFAAYLISQSLIRYDCDYLKMIQGYNFGTTVLDRIIAAKGDDWMSERANAKNYATNWPYQTYGDAQYIEHVLRYYQPYMDYIGAKVRVDGKLIEFKNQYPIIEHDRTLIPIRGLLETLGAEVEWDHDNYTAIVKRNGVEVSLPIGSTTAFVNGEAIELDVPAELRNGRTLIPLRFIMDSFGIEIEWDQETRTVNIKN